MKRPIRIPLKYKLMISYLSIFALLALFVFIGNQVMDNRFSTYFTDRTEEEIESITGVIIDEIVGGQTDMTKIMDNIPGPTRFYISYYNQHGKLISEVNSPLSSPRFSVFSESRISDNHKDFENMMDTRIKTVTKEVIVDNVNYGTLKIMYFDSDVINENDINLVNQFTLFFRIVLAVIVIIGVIISFLMARSITKPIKAVSDTANKIREGQLDTRASVSTNTKELLELSKSINYLGETLQQEELLRSQMTSDMAHEIRTPLTTLRNFLEAFIDGVWIADDDKLNKCYTEVLRMNDLVERLKDIASLEESNLKYNDIEIDFSSELSNIAHLYVEQFQDKNISYKIEIEPNIEMLMDPHKLNQIFSNLISNSLRYTDAEGTVTLKCTTNNKRVLVTVSDTGIGINPDDIPYIFERFYRAEKSRSRASGGMGIGLTIVQKLVLAYKGDIEVTSEESQGTTFEVSFPM